MNKCSTWLLDYKRDVYSQTGEDGVIEKILEVIPQNNKWCVEFGAWDGQFLSNTRYLIESKYFSSIQIEGNRDKYLALERTYSNHDNVFTLNKFVGFKNDDNLDHILCATPIPRDFDFLSIDIDGNDYHAWKSISKYTPKLVAIEYNPTIPTNIRFIQVPDPSVHQGASLLSLVELGKEKGYELASVLPCNAFFVRKEYYPLLQMESNEPEVLRTNLNAITYLFSGYDGNVFLRGCRKLPWHDIEIKQSKVQILPKFLRAYPGEYTITQKIAFKLYLLVIAPLKFARDLKRRLDQLTRRSS